MSPRRTNGLAGFPGDALLVGWRKGESSKRAIGFHAKKGAASRRRRFAPITSATDGHLLTIAPTGAGKGVGSILPALLTYDGPVIAICPKGESAAIAARRRREMGQRVVLLDPMRVTSHPGDALNPLQWLDPKSDALVDQAAAVAHALIERGQDERNRYWYDRGVHLLTGAILQAVVDQPEQSRHLASVRTTLAMAASDSDAYLALMRCSRHPEVRAIGSSLDVAARETRGSIVSIAQDGVDFVRGPLVQAATNTTSFDLKDVTRGTPLTIFLVLPPHMLESHGRLLRLWVSTLMNAITARRSRPEKATLLLLDEAAQLGELPQLRQAITLLRGYGLRTWSFWQDLSQLQRRYSDWKTMVHNCETLQCFGSFSAGAAAEMAALLDLPMGTAQQPTDVVVRMRGGEPQIARRPDYRTDPVFRGMFDPNPYFDTGVDPLRPEPTLNKEPAAEVVPSPVSEPMDQAGLLQSLLSGWS